MAAFGLARLAMRWAMDGLLGADGGADRWKRAGEGLAHQDAVEFQQSERVRAR